MIFQHMRSSSIRRKSTDKQGFTLVELMIVLAVSAILGTAVIGNFIQQKRSSVIVRQTAQLQQQLRGAMYILEQDIRMAGYDPERTGLFGIVDVQRRDLNGQPNQDGFPSLTISFDWSPGNSGTSGDGIQNEPSPTYLLFDENGNGQTDLGRLINGNIELVAQGIEAISFAFAYDDGTGELARLPGGEIIWAVNNSPDNVLNERLDGSGETVALPEAVSPDRIRAVRIWVLARAPNADQRHLNSMSYVVGDQLIQTNDGFRRRMLERIVQCRNLGV
jgi:type IV pilus assembly protein PilW